MMAAASLPFLANGISRGLPARPIRRRPTRPTGWVSAEAQFSDAYATSNGHVGSISDSHWTAEAVELQPSSSSLFGGGPGGYFQGGYGGYLRLWLRGLGLLTESRYATSRAVSGARSRRR